MGLAMGLAMGATWMIEKIDACVPPKTSNTLILPRNFACHPP
jgi:hypothetical protein